MNRDEWPFDQVRNAATLTTSGVIERGLPVLVAIHYADDHSWAFLCGTTNRDEDARLIALGEFFGREPLIDIDPDFPLPQHRVNE